MNAQLRRLWRVRTLELSVTTAVILIWTTRWPKRSPSCKVGDKKFHPGFPGSGLENRGKYERVSKDNDDEKEPEESKLLRLVEKVEHLLAVAGTFVDKATESCDIVKLKSNCAACNCVFPPITALSHEMVRNKSEMVRK